MINIAIQLDPTLATPLYKQLSQSIENAILAGELQKGDRLPPTRQMCTSLKMARRTVVKAYDELLSKGYLEGKVGAGTKVSDHLPRLGSGQAQSVDALDQSLPAWTYNLSAYGKELLDCDAQTVPELLMGGDFMCLPQNLLPVKSWRQMLVRYCQPELDLEFDAAPDPAGYEPLRAAVTQFLTRTRGVICHPDQVIVYPGSRLALSQIIKVLIDPDDSVVVENPGAENVRRLLLAAGAILHSVQVDDAGFSVASASQLNDAPKLVYATPHCQNPTGIIMSSERRKQLLDWSREKGVLILEDALDSDFRYGTQPVASLQGLSPTNVIYFYSFENLLFPLTNISVLVLPPQLVQAFRSARASIERCGSTLDCYALADFIKDGHLDVHARRVRRAFQERRQMLVHNLSICLRQAVSLSPRTAGQYMFVQFDRDFSEKMILSCAEQSGLPLINARASYTADLHESGFLIPLSRLDESKMHSQIEQFASLLLQAVDEEDDQPFDCSPR